MEDINGTFKNLKLEKWSQVNHTIIIAKTMVSMRSAKITNIYEGIFPERDK